MLTPEDSTEFAKIFPQLVAELVTLREFEDIPQVTQWLEKVLNYNVPNGKNSRGLLLVMAFRSFSTKEPSNDQIQKSYVLGWCVELLQAFFFLFDDMMDQSEERRGQKCWHLVGGIGQSAINDGLLLEHALFKILQLHFRTHDRYPDLVDLLHDVTFKTAYGQSLDTHTTMWKKVDKFDLKLYASTVKYKLSYYTFVLPVTLAMILADVRGKKLVRDTQSLLLDLGELYQLQDDQLDIFGPPEKGTGTTIQSGQCSWPVCQFLQLATPDQTNILIENYGKKEAMCCERVKKLFEKVDLLALYQQRRKEMVEMLGEKIEKLPKEAPSSFFKTVLSGILNRTLCAPGSAELDTKFEDDVKKTA